VLTKVLPDAMNTEFRRFHHCAVDTINGKKIKSLNEAYKALNPEDMPEFHVIEFFGQGRPLVLETSRIPVAHKRILKAYRIQKDHWLGEPEKATRKPKQKDQVR